MNKIDSVRTTNVWSSARTLLTGGSNTTFSQTYDLDFFNDGVSTYRQAEWNDLNNPKGALPENRWGIISGLFVGFQVATSPLVGTFTAVMRDQVNNTIAELRKLMLVETYLGGVLCYRGSVSDYGTPGPWHIGAPTAGTVSLVENSGFLLQFTPHEYAPNTDIRVRVRTRPGTVLNTAGTIIADGCSLVVAVQTVDQKTTYTGK